MKESRKRCQMDENYEINIARIKTGYRHLTNPYKKFHYEERIATKNDRYSKALWNSEVVPLDVG